MKYDFEVGKENFKLSSVIESNQRELVKVALDFVEKEGFKIKDNILDLGSGDGWFQTIHPSAISVSANSEDIKQGEEKGFNMIFADAHDLPFDKDMFDVVWARQCLEHFVSPYIALKEIHRVLKDDGFAVIILPVPLNTLIFAKTHLYVMNDAMWINLFMKTGFNIEYAIKTKTAEIENTWDEYIFIIRRNKNEKENEHHIDKQEHTVIS